MASTRPYRRRAGRPAPARGAAAKVVVCRQCGPITDEEASPDGALRCAPHASEPPLWEVELQLAAAAPSEENVALQQVRRADGEDRRGPRGRRHGDRGVVAVVAGARGPELAQQVRQSTRSGERLDSKCP